MRGSFLIVLAAALVAAVILLRGRERPAPERALSRLREGIEGALEDVEARVDSLRGQARRLSGEARRRLQDQAHELEARQGELRRRLDDLRAEAGRLLERARSQGEDAG